MKTITADTILFVPFVRERINVGKVRHCNVECSIENCDLRDIRQEFRCSFNPCDIGGIMKWRQLLEIADGVKYLSIN